MDTFGGVSGLKLNPSKTKALWLGSLRNCKDNPFNFKWPKEPIRILGTFVSYDEKQNEEKNFGQKMQKLDTILDIWNARNLTRFGRCRIIKSLGISQLVHSIFHPCYSKRLCQGGQFSVAFSNLFGERERIKPNAKLRH